MNYGCGLSAPEKWLNYDSSPSLRMQRVPLFGRVAPALTGVSYPPSVKFGDIVKGLPVEDRSCDGVYSSHVIEHLPRIDAGAALRNTFRMLKPGGVFRVVVPDLEVLATSYLAARSDGDLDAAHRFMDESGLGLAERKPGLRGQLRRSLGASAHLWLWDHASLQGEAEMVGFVNPRRCEPGDSDDEMFRVVENESRFARAVALEMKRPLSSE